jgi:hypothetical protein
MAKVITSRIRTSYEDDSMADLRDDGVVSHTR